MGAAGLPVAPSPLVGRERDVASICTSLQATARLVTITGPGGIGKTRVALQVAGALADHFPSAGYTTSVATSFRRVVFVPLAPIDDSKLVPAAIARALGAADASGTVLLARLTDILRTESTLIVLDNFEHLLTAVPLVAELLAACPALCALATSRAPLRLSGEHEYPLAPLDGATAVDLFVQRARAVRPDFHLTPENGRAVAEICVRLDGLPRAIELAAARTKMLGPAALLARLSRRLALLTGGPRDVPARQQTLRSTVDWSYALLSPTERLLFARLGVFSGGWTLDDAECVAAPTAATASTARPSSESASEAVLEHLAALVDNSLVIRREGADGESRFSMLETIREYALDRLVAFGQEEDARSRHATRYAELADVAGAHLRGPDQARWLERLEREHANLRDALRWWTGHASRTPAPADPTSEGSHAPALVTALSVGGALWRYWWVRGYLTEGRALLSALLECPLPAERDEAMAGARGEIAFGAGVLAYTAADFELAGNLYAEARALWETAGDASGVAYAIENLGEVDLALGRLESARAQLEDSIARFRALDDDQGVAWPLAALGMARLLEGDFSSSVATLEECLDLFRQLGDHFGEALALDFLALAHVEQGDLAAAGDNLAASLSIRRRLGERTGLGFTLDITAAIAATNGLLEGAARLAAAAAGLRDTYGSPVLPPLRAMLDARIVPVRARLGAAVFDRVWKEGYGAGPEAAMAAALELLTSSVSSMGRTSPAERPPSYGPLSPREVEVAALVAGGLTNREIASRLIITPSTAGVHVGHILDKLGLHTRAQIATWFTERRASHSLSTTDK